MFIKWFILPVSSGIIGYLFAIDKYVDIAAGIRKKYIDDIKHFRGRSLLHGDHRALSEDEIQAFVNNDIRAIINWKKRSYWEKLLLPLPINGVKPKMMTHYD